MPASRLAAFAALAVGCLGAAAAGGYLAMRQNVVPAPTQAAASQEPTASAPAPPAPVPVPGQLPAIGFDSAPTAPPAAPASPAGPSRSAKRAESARAAAVQASARPAARERGVKAEPAAPADRPLPGAGGSAQAPAPATPAENGPPPARADDRAQEATRAPEPSENTFDELVVSADSVIGLQAQTTVTSDRARVEDRVEARVTRDVRVRGIVAVPAGARVMGSVVSVERGGKFRDRARLGIRFNTLVLPDGTRLPISTETIYREGEAPGKQSTAKVAGPAVAGAILGAIIGGGKGAAIGGAVGAGAGAGAVAAGDRSLATLYAGEPITVRLLAPVTVTIEHK